MILFCGRASAFRQEWQYVNDTVVVVLTRSLVTLAGQLGATAGYAGRWLLAVGVDELSGKLSASGFHLGRGYAPFSATTYVQGTEAGTTELLEQPGAVTRRLVGRLLRALGNRTVSATQSNAGGPQLHLSSTAGQGRPAQAMGAGRPFLGWREFEAMTSTCWGERRAGHRAVRGAA